MDPLTLRLVEVWDRADFRDRACLVGGAVRDRLLGRPDSGDLDIVVEGDALRAADLIWQAGLAAEPPQVYPRFGTAMLMIDGRQIEFAWARAESYDPESRKPDTRPADLAADARRRDFTINSLMQDLRTGEVLDLTGSGLADLREGILRTPLDPAQTFRDDPLRMLRAVRFRVRFGFRHAEGLPEALAQEADRLRIVSAERVQAELVKMLTGPDPAEAMDELMRHGLLAVFAPELAAMKGVEQGKWHHLDVWDHTLLVLRNAASGDLILNLACLLHDVGKPATRKVIEGETRFLGHETVGGEIAGDLLLRLRFSTDLTERVARLVRAHMRLGTLEAAGRPALRRLVRDLGEDLDRLFALVQADVSALRPGVRVMDVEAIRARVADLKAVEPSAYESPISGRRIMELTGLPPGPAVGSLKQALLSAVLDGELAPGDEAAAESLVMELHRAGRVGRKED
ncbi:MAG: CCA tRNA nucleotidyltransferase [Fimbriimonadaceae bacterium]|nr:CCA tRNA nucleotidyltransferase [Fimbriimonadaceae bacterium]